MEGYEKRFSKCWSIEFAEPFLFFTDLMLYFSSASMACTRSMFVIASELFRKIIS